MRDVLLPLLIVAACGGIVTLVRVLTRPKPSRSDLVIPEPSPTPAAPTPAAAPPGGGASLRVALADWHLEFGDTLLDRIDTADHLVDPSTAAPVTDDADTLASAFVEATEAHPAPEMRAELAAMQAAIEALGHARASGDDEAVERHRATYLAYRSRWLERLWQFPADAARVTMLRQRGLAERLAAPTAGSEGPPPNGAEPATSDSATTSTASSGTSTTATAASGATTATAASGAAASSSSTAVEPAVGPTATGPATESAEPTEPAELTEPTEPAEPTEPVESTEPAESTETAEPVATTTEPDPTEPSEPASTSPRRRVGRGGRRR